MHEAEANRRRRCRRRAATTARRQQAAAAATVARVAWAAAAVVRVATTEDSLLVVAGSVEEHTVACTAQWAHTPQRRRAPTRRLRRPRWPSSPTRCRRRASSTAWAISWTRRSAASDTSVLALPSEATSRRQSASLLSSSLLLLLLLFSCF